MNWPTDAPGNPPDDKVVDFWSEPQPLPKPPPPPAFDAEFLPPVLRDWVADISDRIQAPLDYAAVGALVALGSVLGRKVIMHPKANDSWGVPCNLWGGVVGSPASSKSPVLSEVLKPLRELENESAEVFEMDLQEHAARQMVTKGMAEARGKEVKAKAKDKPKEAYEIALALQQEQTEPEPTCRRYLTNDATTAKEHELLSQNPNGYLKYRDELTGWLSQMDRDENSCDRAFYLECWNGTGAFTYDRIGRGTVRTESTIMSVLGGIQPGPLQKYVVQAVNGGAKADGLLQRIQLMVWPTPKRFKYTDRPQDAVAYNKVRDLFRLAANTEPVHLGGTFKDDAAHYRFDPSAQQSFAKWLEWLHNDLVPSAADQSTALASHLKKYASLVPKLALIYHFADGGRGPVSKEAFDIARDFAIYLEEHARRVYADGVDSDVYAAQVLLAKIKEGKLKDGDKAFRAYRNQWGGLDRNAAYGGLELLEQLGYLRVEERHTSTKPAVFIRINPRVLRS